MLQEVKSVVVEIDPDFDPVVGLIVLGRDESEPTDMFVVGKVLSQKIENEVIVQFVLIFLTFGDGEDESSSVLVVRVLPLGLDALLEVFD